MPLLTLLAIDIFLRCRGERNYDGVMPPETTQPDDHDLRASLIARIFYIQVALVFVASALIPVSIYVQLGWFWVSFLAGIFGASVALLRTVNRGGDIAHLSNRSWPLLMSPLLYGGILASIAYFLMASGLLSGESGDGILRLNLFPTFGPSEIMNELAHMKNYLKVRPNTLPDAAKLTIWCLVAGYSENFITGVLTTLERQGSRFGDSNESE